MAAIISIGSQLSNDSINFLNRAILLSLKRFINVILETAVFFFSKVCLFNIRIVAPESSNVDVNTLSMKMFAHCESLIMSD